MIRHLTVASALALTLLLTGCSSMKLEQFQGTTPAFDLTGYFEGQTWAHGIFESRGGEIKRQFRVEIDGYWEGEEFVLDEDFVYDDGETDQRTWRITPTGEGRYVGRAGDIVGEAAGHEVGQALNWRYVLRLPYGDSTIDVAFDDWMIRRSENVVINRATVTKFGIRVGEVTLFFTKTDPDGEAS
ncbi:DUF3833 family protein [Guyparkeria halophila]|uniref:DUF3833 family protein n=1 Tax=Guyparkeria halophila TaxID=47960 RepID=A0A6I6D0S7_9GAMM|nr:MULTISPECIES: DUF3833 domain-containing protein [Guyparkeria]QGT77657.1 DUF3833 family protein [Guyparkeria halophila]TKA90097.1 DUF3833 domain-containing protein [Guyparkeria sp. SB14A]